MLNKFKGFFQVKSPYNKKLIQSSLVSNSDELLLDDLLYLINCFESGTKENASPIYFIEEYFKLALNEEFIQFYLIRSKMLLTVHLMVHEYQIGVDFAAIFLDQKFTFFKQQSQKKEVLTSQQEPAQWITTFIQLPYYQYLQRLSSNIQVFHACKVQSYPSGGDKDYKIDVQTKILWLFKIINMINNGLAQMDQIKVGLVQYPKELLLKEIVLVYWSDIIIYYNFLSKEILTLLDYYRHLKPNICLQFYELYLQLFQIRNNISELYKFRKHFDKDNVISQPKWFEVNKPLHKDVETFIAKQRLEVNQKKVIQTDRIDTNPTHKRTQSQVMLRQITNPTKLNLDKLREYDAKGGKKEKIIQTHRPGRKYSFDEEDEENFEQMKKVLQNDNLQQRITNQKKLKLKIDNDLGSIEETEQFE